MAGTEDMMAKFNALPINKKAAIAAVIAISIAGMMLLLTWINKADYQVLFSNLSEGDAAGIVEELKSKHVDYRLQGTGVILVQSGDVYDLRLQLASAGLPQGGNIGFEIFDNASFTTSEFVQKLNFKRGLEGELSRTIRSLSGVQQCRVHLVMPEKTVFAFQEEKSQASAAVFISLNQGRRLSKGEVQGIVHLISSGVEGLSSENITVVDNKGVLLTNPSDDSVMGLSNNQMEYQRTFEKNLVDKITEILEPVAGHGKIQAKVSAVFDFTRSERTEEKYDPEGVVVRSEQKSTEKTTSGGGTGGVPGTASNLPGGAGAQASSSMGQSQKQDETINYETSKTITRVVESPISLERLTVAIIVDGLLDSQTASVENAEQYTKRTEDDIQYYKNIVKNTIGFTGDRGDEISVTVMPFTKSDAGVIEEAGTDVMQIVYTVLKYLAPVIVAILFFLFLVKPLINMISKMPSAAQSLAVAGRAASAELEGPLRPKEIPVEKRVVEWASQNPGEAAGVVKDWVEEK